MTLTRALCAGVGLSLVLALGGCSIYSVPGSQPVPVETDPEYTPVTPPPATPERAPAPTPAPKPEPTREAPSTSAYQALLTKAESARDRGDYETSLALLERAQRIDPDNAEIYLNLAMTHEASGDRGQAKATAERGLLYCHGSVQCDALRAYLR